MRTDKKLIGTTIFTAIAASLCCITPVLALIAGSSGIASTFSWIEPFRPYLIAITILVLVFAWYQLLKPKTAEQIACECEEGEKKPFMQTKSFLGIVTVFALLMLAFPYYSKIFYPDNRKEIVVTDQSDIQKAEFKIEGMTCTACEEHINHAVNELDGILNVSSSFEKGTAEIEFDNSETKPEDIENAINATGYKVIK